MAIDNFRICLGTKLFIWSFLLNCTALAQIIPDTTLGSEQSEILPNIDTAPKILIQGGASRNNNLFHSFQDFNVRETQQVHFSNPAGIQNIFSRVTGINPTNILGTLGVAGSANLYLLNRNGIIFGQNAQIDIAGSFLATTAESLVFDNFLFSSTNINNVPPASLLSISTPIGLQFGNSPSSIEVLGSTLLAGVDQTLALVGGDVKVEGNPELSSQDQLTLGTAGGRIEIGAVDSNSFVSISPIQQGFILEYDQVKEFRDITLSQEASINVSDFLPIVVNIILLPDGQLIPIFPISSSGSGEIQLNGRRIRMADGAQLTSANFFEKPGKEISLTASESIEMTGNSRDGAVATAITTAAVGKGKGGDINIDTVNFFVRNGAGIITGSTPFSLDGSASEGNSGNLTIRASEIQVSGSSQTAGNSVISVRTSGEGDAGNLQLITKELTLADGGEISAATESSGLGGDIRINATDSVKLTGTGFDVERDLVSGEITNITRVPSNILASTSDTGNAGSVEIQTNQFQLSNEAATTVSSEGDGNAGMIDIQAASILLANQAKLSAETTDKSTGKGGDIRLNSQALEISNNSEISVSTLNPNNVNPAGDISIQAQYILLDNLGKIVGETIAAEGGDLTIRGDESLSLNNKSSISTRGGFSAFGNSGNITLQTKQLTLENNSDITASSAGTGDAGFINIETESTLLNDGSRITAETSETSTGLGGSIRFDTQRLVINDESEISVSNLNPRNLQPAGDVNVQAQSILLANQSQISAETESGAGGDINIDVDETLELRNGSLITTRAGQEGGGGDGGNIEITAKFIAAVSAEDSNIFANAFSGSGGNILLNAEAIFGLFPQERLTRLSDIVASSELGASGMIDINRPDIDPQSSLLQVSTEFRDPEELAVEVCGARGVYQKGKFTITGKSGVPADPLEQLGGGVGIEDLGISPEGESHDARPMPPQGSIRRRLAEDIPKPLVEVQGWTRDANGKVVLTAQVSGTHKRQSICHDYDQSSAFPLSDNSDSVRLDRLQSATSSTANH